MKIDFTKNGATLNISLNGRLDTVSAPEFEAFVKANVQDVTQIELDCANLTYISSAGLRVLLGIQKKLLMPLTLTNVQELVMEIFEITGFVDILTIK